MIGMGSSDVCDHAEELLELCLCLLGRYVMHHADLSWVRMCPILVIDVCKEGNRLLFYSTPDTIEHRAMFTSHFHQIVEISVMLFIIPVMDNDIIFDSSHTITVVKYLVHHAFEDVLCTDQVPGEADNLLSSPW